MSIINPVTRCGDAAGLQFQPLRGGGRSDQGCLSSVRSLRPAWVNCLKRKRKKGLIVKSCLREKWDKDEEDEGDYLIMYVPQKEDITENSESYKGKRMRPKMS